MRFFNKAIFNNGQPSLINNDNSGPNNAAINGYSEENNTHIEILQRKYLNNIIDQDYRFVTRLTRPMMGVNLFYCAQKTLARIELNRMTKKGQYRYSARGNKSLVELFYTLAT